MMIKADPTDPQRAVPDGSPDPVGLRKGEHVRGVQREVLADYCAHAYNGGASLEAIGAIVGRSRGAVAVLLSESDVPLQARERHLSPQRRATLRAELPSAYLAGASLRELGTQYNVSPATVRRILIDSGVTLRPQGSKTLAFRSELAGSA